MKSNNNTFRKLSSITFSLLLLLFYSCKKDNDKPVEPPKDNALKVTSLSNTTLH